MKKNVFGRQFKRDINERKALFNNLMTSLVIHDRIQTTEEKAKAIKGAIEKLVTKAKKKGVDATPELLAYLHKDAVKRMISVIAPRFTNRPGGYTRIIKLRRRFGDNASVVLMEWVESSSKLTVPASAKALTGKQNSKLEKEVKTEKIEATAKVKKSKSSKLPKQPKNLKKKVVARKPKGVKKTTVKKGGKK